MNLSKQFTRREKILLAILAVILVAAVYFLAVHRPVTESLARIDAASQEAQTELTILQAKAVRLTTMRSELDAILAEGAAAEIPDYDNLQRLMTFLNTTLSSASDYDLSFQAVQIPTEGNIARRSVQMVFVCPSYESARSIIETLRDCPYRCLADGLSIAPAAQNARGTEARPLTAGAVQVSLSITFFEKLS